MFFLFFFTIHYLTKTVALAEVLEKYFPYCQKFTSTCGGYTMKLVTFFFFQLDNISNIFFKCYFMYFLFCLDFVFLPSFVLV